MNQLVLTVSQLNNYAKSILEQDAHLRCCMVAGEISNFTNHYRSGHLYMSLKDDVATIKAVMFKSSVVKLKFMPEDGMKVLCRGRVSIYDRDGQYQFYIEEMIPDGIGALSVAFNQLKEKLENEGLFKEICKKPIPAIPKKIGVITSPTGAAVQDIIKILSRRYPLCEMMLFPVQVQGENAAPQMVNALKIADSCGCDVIIIGRGGGSTEDLWAFNDETLARTIFSAKTPIISAVGHETDFTICDFVADLRAPTPSAAAELAVPDINEILDVLECAKQLLNYNFKVYIDDLEHALKDISTNRCFSNPEDRIYNTRLMYFDNISYKFQQLNKEYHTNFCHQLELLSNKLDVFSPLENLKRGYSLVEKNGKVINKVNDLNIGDCFSVRFSDGQIIAERKE